MFCKECGFKLQDDSKFCPQCGAKQELPSHVESLEPKPKQAKKKTEVLPLENEGTTACDESAEEALPPAKTSWKKSKVIQFAIAAFFAVVIINQLTSSAEPPLFTHEQICVAAISAEFNVTTYAISSTKQGSGNFHISYNEFTDSGETDGKYWDYLCKVNGSRVVWAAPGGRWRDNYDYDSEIRYSVDVNIGQLTIRRKWPDGSVNKNDFGYRQLTGKRLKSLNGVKFDAITG